MFATLQRLKAKLPPLPKILEQDLTETFLKGSGPGGQKINKTNSAVQLKHLPTGFVVKCQATRSREQNRKIARRLLAEELDVKENGETSREALKAAAERKKKQSKKKKTLRKLRGKDSEEETEGEVQINTMQIEQGSEEADETQAHKCGQRPDVMSDSENDQQAPVYDEGETTPVTSTSKRKREQRTSDSDDSSIGYKKSRKLSKAAQQKIRPRGGPSHITSIPVDDHGNPYEIEDDEVGLPEDPAGEKKVTKLGYLNGSREYRCRTFTILGRGQKLYMLSTEPARCMGFRDSYLFLQKHKKLYKMIMDDDEKFDMIRRDIIPHSYKGRAIGVITARSIFREFGAKIIVGGRKIQDDYYEAKARADGAVYGELADPDDKLPPPGIAYNRNQYVAWHGASSVYHTQPSAPTPVFPKKKKVLVTQENWMYEHAKAASGFNQMLLEQRAQHFRSGIYEPHTNIQMFARISQPSRIARWRILSKDSPRDHAVVDTALEGYPFTIPGDGLKDVDPSVYEACSEEVKEAIREQQRKEHRIESVYEGGEQVHGLRARLKLN